MKTIKEWFELIADPTIRKQALENYDPNYSGPQHTSTSLDDAIGDGFDWSGSPQGYNYWHEVCRKAEKGEIKLREQSKLKVGDVIPVEVLNKWVRSGKNEYRSNTRKWLEPIGILGDWRGDDRKVTKIDIIDDIEVFEVEGSCDRISIRLEGFYEFWKGLESPSSSGKVELTQVKKFKGKSGEEFEVGKCYVSSCNEVIVKIIEKESSDYNILCSAVYLVSRSFESTDRWMFSGKGWREASKEETAWLEACISAGKFVERPSSSDKNSLTQVNQTSTKKEPSKEELLEEARRRYPVGTEYTCASDKSLRDVIKSHVWADSDSDDVIFAEYLKGCLYYKGKWAEIHTPAKEKAPEKTPLEICKEKYKPGMTIIPVHASGESLEAKITVTNGQFATNLDGMVVWIPPMLGFLYANGKYAEIVEPKDAGKPQLEKGKYYSCRHISGTKYYFIFDKMSEIANNHFRVDGWRIQEGTWSDVSSYWSITHNTDFKEVSEAEAKDTLEVLKDTDRLTGGRVLDIETGSLSFPLSIPTRAWIPGIDPSHALRWTEVSPKNSSEISKPSKTITVNIDNEIKITTKTTKQVKL